MQRISGELGLYLSAVCLSHMHNAAGGSLHRRINNSNKFLDFVRLSETEALFRHVLRRISVAGGSIGPSTESRGTLWLTSVYMEESLFILTNWNRSDKYDLIP